MKASPWDDQIAGVLVSGARDAVQSSRDTFNVEQTVHTANPSTLVAARLPAI